MTITNGLIDAGVFLRSIKKNVVKLAQNMY